LNDAVSFIGLQTVSERIILRHPNLTLKAAGWHELLAHKLSAFRGRRDVSDAEEIPFLDLVQFVWRRGWNLSSAVDPRELDPIRYALKASILDRMIELWIAPPRSGSESSPEWCSHVPPSRETFSVIHPDHMEMWRDEPWCPACRERNIFAPESFMFFL